MAEISKLENSEALGPSRAFAEMDDQTNSSQFTNTKPDSFAVDMDHLSHLADTEKPSNSRIFPDKKLQRGFSRKGSQQRGNEKKIAPSSAVNERDTNIESAASPRAALAASSTLEKPMVVTVGTANHPMNSPQVLHHQITITTGNTGGAINGAESRSAPKRLGSRRSPLSWTADPRRIVFFFATLSSMGTLLLIYFTLSMGKVSGDDNSLEW